MQRQNQKLENYSTLFNRIKSHNKLCYVKSMAKSRFGLRKISKSQAVKWEMQN